LTDRSRRPVRYANQLPRQIESLIVAAKRDKPHWGCPEQVVARVDRVMLRDRKFADSLLEEAGFEPSVTGCGGSSAKLAARDAGSPRGVRDGT
jgi:hypothetical protein